jgi:hypothetical protein
MLPYYTYIVIVRYYGSFDLSGSGKERWLAVSNVVMRILGSTEWREDLD